MISKQTPYVQFLTLILLFAVLFSLRSIHLDADPPKTLDPISIGHLSDPGGYVFNARNKILYGTWKTDEWNLMYFNFLIHIITYIVFLVFGVGIAQMNAVPAVFSCLILIFIYLILKRTLNQTYAFIGILLLGTNFQFTMFSRIAVRVMPMLFFTVLAIYFLTTAKKNKSLFFLAGIMCFFSFTTKGTFLLILPSIVLGILFYNFFQTGKNIKTTLVFLGLFVLGMVVPLFVWLFLFWLPQRELFQDFARNNYNWLTPHSLSEAFKNFWIRPLNYLKNMPVQTFLSSLYLPFLFCKAVKSPRKISLVTWIAGFWLISNYLYISVVYYRPWRHAVPLIIPIVIIAVVALYEFMQIKSIQKPKKIPVLLYVFLLLWFLFPLSNLVILKSRPMTLNDMRTQSLVILGICFSLIVLLTIVFKFWPKNLNIPISHLTKGIILIPLIVFSLYFNLRHYFNWVLSPRHDIKNISQDLGKAYDRITIGGLIAPLITLENQHRAHSYHTGYINKGLDFIQKYKITHLFILDYFDEKRVYQRDFPKVMEKAELIARYSIWKGYFEFYDLNPSPPQENKDTETLEGETFFGEGGIPRFDETASGNFAFFAEKSQKSLIQLPIKSYPPGNYNVFFSLMVEERDWGKEERLKIDIADLKRKRILSSKTLSPRDFTSPEGYNHFNLHLELNKPVDILFRVYKTGKITLWFDSVSVRKCEKMHSSMEP